jgi:hypothetical protein
MTVLLLGAAAAVMRPLLLVVLCCVGLIEVEGWTIPSPFVSTTPSNSIRSNSRYCQHRHNDHFCHSSALQRKSTQSTRLFAAAASASSEQEADDGDDKVEEEEDVIRALQAKAEKLRQEVASLQKEKRDAMERERLQVEQELSERLERRLRYSAEVPIFKEDGSTVVERVDFPPLFVSGESRIVACTAPLPLGMILGEYVGFDTDNDHEEGEAEPSTSTPAGDDDTVVTSTTSTPSTASTIRRPMAIRIDAIAEGSNAETAGVQVGDLLRACTATQTIMDAPTWQILAGGIGMPKTKRVMYGVDGRPFEEVIDAIASNRMDPMGRPVVLVLERP